MAQMQHDGPSTPTSPTHTPAPVPMFLFSMPRSGSTLLQRLLATHPEIDTGPEPTFLLPLLHIGSDRETLATFDQRFTSWAVEDFLASTGDGEESFSEMVRAAAEVAYRHASSGPSRYFLDKTPKYHMIADRLLGIFPESPAIVLWRHPLAVIGSLMATWGGAGGRWNLQHFRLDLFEALPGLIAAVERHGDRRLQTVRYEDLVSAPHEVLRPLVGRLGLDYDPATVERFGEVELEGRVQDPNVTTADFRLVRADRVDRWKSVLANPLRRAWCRRYLRWLGQERMAVMGYDLDAVLSELDELDPSWSFLASDVVRMPYDTLYRLGELGVFAKKARDLRAGRPLLAHK
jgi:hypothetical protein